MFQKKTERTLVEKAGLFHLRSFSFKEEKFLLRKVPTVVIDGIFSVLLNQVCVGNKINVNISPARNCIHKC